MASGFDQDEPAVAPTKPAGILAKERENGAAGASLLVQVGAKLRWVSTIPHFSLRYFFGSWIQTLFKHQVWSDQQLNIWSTALECFGDQKRHVHIYTDPHEYALFGLCLDVTEMP